MDGGRLPRYRISRQFRFHPYARVKPSPREIVTAVLYDNTYNEECFIPSSPTTSPSSSTMSYSGTVSDGGKLPSYKLSRRYRFHLLRIIPPDSKLVEWEWGDEMAT
ncbi:hypothetical protein PISMIDRAFT_19403 [Pisolithus microcarpus 441]|uniref:Uncharacterized protein n=1 Tax=Pisolithus microcarpus 441 TaxID=765257 RepID=A0A0C9XH23_9AGAM|nr:hypothetical protein BKA83DRAFT_19403 [Pisolithus microcarpus]KIK11580.1 hypothetical protein PISMIDRAFT_19403 [Pisolithus microcarpus 441]